MSDKPGLLLTGASGFVGRHAIRIGRDRFDIVATGRGSRPEWLPADVAWHSVDLLDRASVATMPKDLPYVLHLASETVPSKFLDYDPLLDSVEMTLNLCRHLTSGRLLLASSCLVYAASRNPLPEDARVEPRGHYGLAKVLCEQIVLGAGLKGNLETAIARPFNHIGVGMRSDLVIPSIVRRLRETEAQSPIHMAGINSVRDFLDVQDIVEAYFAILRISGSDEKVFNVCSGVPTSISEVILILAAGLGKEIGDIVFSEANNSADDTSVVLGDAAKLRDMTNWSPRIELKEGLRRLIEGG